MDAYRIGHALSHGLISPALSSTLCPKINQFLAINLDSLIKNLIILENIKSTTKDLTLPIFEINWTMLDWLV